MARPEEPKSKAQRGKRGGVLGDGNPLQWLEVRGTAVSSRSGVQGEI